MEVADMKPVRRPFPVNVHSKGNMVIDIEQLELIHELPGPDATPICSSAQQAAFSSEKCVSG